MPGAQEILVSFFLMFYFVSENVSDPQERWKSEKSTWHTTHMPFTHLFFCKSFTPFALSVLFLFPLSLSLCIDTHNSQRIFSEPFQEIFLISWPLSHKYFSMHLLPKIRNAFLHYYSAAVNTSEFSLIRYFNIPSIFIIVSIPL